MILRSFVNRAPDLRAVTWVCFLCAFSRFSILAWNCLFWRFLGKY